MSDLHMRILRLVARRAQRELNEHDAADQRGRRGIHGPGGKTSRE